MTHPKRRKQNGRGLFALAAIIYMAGVVVFSIWSYLQERENILSQLDRSLINGTHAIEQILGDIFIECSVEVGTSDELGGAAKQKKLNQFANDCHFDLIGAMGYKDAKLWGIIGGGKPRGDLGMDTSDFDGMLRSDLSSLVWTLVNSGNISIQIQTMELERYGKIRIAARYHPISSDDGYAILVAHSMDDINQPMHTLVLRTVAIGLFLYAMAFPLIALYNRTQMKSSKETAKLNAQLQQDFIQLKEREAELEDAIHDLERFNSVALDREGRVIQLKAEVNTLLEQTGRQKRYNIDHVD